MPQLTSQQQLAVESIGDNVIVSAGAGSGKTMVLVERYLKVLAEHEDATINEIIAVTFTRKAAEEMRIRLKARLQELSESDTTCDKGRWIGLLSQADQARIGTIHSLCESILKAYPVEAGIDPQFEVLDDLTRADFIYNAIEQSLQAMIAAPNSLQMTLLEYPIESIRNWMLRQLQSIPQYQEARLKMGENKDEILAQAHRVVAAVKANALDEFLSDRSFQQNAQYLLDNPWHDSESTLEARRIQTLKLADRIISCLSNRQDQSSLCQAFETIKELAAQPSAGNSGGPRGKELRHAIAALRTRAKDLVDATPDEPSGTDDVAAEALLALLGLIDQAILIYEKTKSASQKADYNDLITRTHKLVTEPDSLARKQISERIRALLVDEFQDTNHTQAELLSSLCGAHARLFLIGDDKQSIYKFQGADVSTFNLWKQLMADGRHGLAGSSQHLDLSHSFRSHPSIVDFVNRFFGFFFCKSDDNSSGHKARHQPLLASRQDNGDPSRVEVILYDLADPAEKRQSEMARAYESRSIAAWILEKLASGTEIFDKEKGSTRKMEFGDFAVLVQANSDFGPIEAALADAGIPYVTFAGSGFLHRQEVYDLENMLRFLECPEDSHPLLGVLRSPFFGINDGILHRVVTEGPGSLWRSLKWAAKQPGFESLHKPLSVLRRLQQEAENSSLPDLIRKIITITSYDVILLSMPNGRQKSRNAWQMVTFTEEYQHLTVADFLKALQTMRELGVNSQTDAPLSSEGAVKLMTIHKSKGLEFPAVVLPVMGRKVHLPAAKLLVHREFGIAFDTSRTSDEPRPEFHRAATLISCQMDAEEKKRLLYVAMTRARDFLAMFIEQGTRNDVSFRYWVKQAAGLDSHSDEQTARANLNEREHFVQRFIDRQGIEEWESKFAGLADSLTGKQNLQDLTAAMSFDLIPAADVGKIRAEERQVAWQALRRVTATNTSEDLHPVIVGNLFHAAMQHYCHRLAVPNRTTLKTLALTPSIGVLDLDVLARLVDEVEQLLAPFTSGNRLSEMLLTATRILPEVSYMMVSDSAVSEKRPDLVFQDERGFWHIVDFKTDRVSDADIESKVNEHREQVSDYASDLEKLGGIKASGWLYFAHLGTLKEVELSSYLVGKKGQLKLPIPN